MKTIFRLVKYIFIFVLAVIVLLVFCILFLVKVLHRPPYFVLTPSYLPNEYSLEESQTTGKGEDRLFVLSYAHPNRGDLTYSCQFVKSKEFKCGSGALESADFVENYSEFRPTKSLGGCAMNLVNKDRERKRAYVWANEESKHMIISFDPDISDSEALQMANSLQPRIFFVSN